MWVQGIWYKSRDVFVPFVAAQFYFSMLLWHFLMETICTFVIMNNIHAHTHTDTSLSVSLTQLKLEYMSYGGKGHFSLVQKSIQQKKQKEQKPWLKLSWACDFIRTPAGQWLHWLLSNNSCLIQEWVQWTAGELLFITTGFLCSRDKHQVSTMLQPNGETEIDGLSECLSAKQLIL